MKRASLTARMERRKREKRYGPRKAGQCLRRERGRRAVKVCEGLREAIVGDGEC